ncbi:MAG: hypothetical protein M3R22_10890 [Pseudomonadota bacterium]|nr:hypothetical protein [Pseudomonadota bacterium]
MTGSKYERDLGDFDPELFDRTGGRAVEVGVEQEQALTNGMGANVHPPVLGALGTRAARLRLTVPAGAPPWRCAAESISVLM